MTEAAPLPVVRLKIPCADGQEFLDKFAGRFVQNGIFVPVARPRAVGSRIHLKLEFRDGTVGVSGSALVTGQGTPEKPGMTLRFTALYPESMQFDLSPARAPARPPPAVPRPSPPAGAGLSDQLFGGDLSGDEPLGPSKPLEVGTRAVKFKLRETPRATEVAAPAGPDRAGPPGEPGWFAPPTPPAPGQPAAADEPAPAEPEEIGSDEVEALPAPRARRRPVGVAAAVLALGAIAAAGLAGAGLLASRRSAERLEAEIRAADARLREGKLVRPAGDSAVDHLLLARDLSPDDQRAPTRLKALADTFEQLGQKAVARGELREAAFHLEAALRADPERARAAQRLREVRARLAAEGPRAR